MEPTKVNEDDRLPVQPALFRRALRVKKCASRKFSCQRFSARERIPYVKHEPTHALDSLGILFLRGWTSRVLPLGFASACAIVHLDAAVHAWEAG